MVEDVKPCILCLHGGGTSAAIFSAQTRGIRLALKAHFNFIFVDGPIASGPGPGVLPYFEDSGPFFRWFSNFNSTKVVAEAELKNLNKSIDFELARQNKKATDVQGVLGFSQGAVVAALILRDAEYGEDARWANIRFATLVCGAGGSQFADMVKEKLTCPSIHVYGLMDPWVSRSKQLMKYFHPDTLEAIEFRGAHHIPAASGDIQRLALLMIELYDDNCRLRFKVGYSTTCCS
ncbi:hypothetical protein DL98DRAFT_437483 [Cadophora sp. DSE1049]|nr:hypothetical protein DL98DRAFT_437483 [Cadophora sp. DSE1049]